MCHAECSPCHCTQQMPLSHVRHAALGPHAALVPNPAKRRRWQERRQRHSRTSLQGLWQQGRWRHRIQECQLMLQSSSFRRRATQKWGALRTWEVYPLLAH